jgi:3-isopropylmalate/(R)-2-methylmalate dehydratase small subunit
MIVKGRALVVGNDINTDLIIAGRYLHLSNPVDLAAHAMEDLDTGFNKKYKKNDIIVSGKNFGCGSSREQAAICLRYKGVNAIIASSFSRIFYRNAINQGIVVIESPQAGKNISEYDIITINTCTGKIHNNTKKQCYSFKPLPQFIQEIINDGGLILHLQKTKKL